MEIERNLGFQPIRELMEQHGLSTHDLVAASTEQLTHKMVSRAVKGRRLTDRAQAKVLKSLNQATESEYGLSDLFNY